MEFETLGMVGTLFQKKEQLEGIILDEEDKLFIKQLDELEINENSLNQYLNDVNNLGHLLHKKYGLKYEKVEKYLKQYTRVMEITFMNLCGQINYNTKTKIEEIENFSNTEEINELMKQIEENHKIKYDN